MSTLKNQREEFTELSKSNPKKAWDYIFKFTVEDLDALNTTFAREKKLKFKYGIIVGLLLAGVVYTFAKTH